MKLHLPKRLFTALLTAITLAAAPAALTLGSAAWGLSVSYEKSFSTTDATSANTDGEITLVSSEGEITYNFSTGVLTLPGTAGRTILEFDMAYTWETEENILFITTNPGAGKKHIGLYALADGTVQGDNNGSLYGPASTGNPADSSVALQEAYAAYGNDDDTVRVKVHMQADSNGTTLYAYGTGENIYYHGSLRYSDSTWTSVTLDSSIVKNVYYEVAEDTEGARTLITSSDGKWKKSYATVAFNSANTKADATVLNEGTLEVEYDSDALSNLGNDIIVGGSGQLRLQTWGGDDNARDLDINISDKKLYLESSTQDNGALNVALSLGVYCGTITLGDIQLIGDTKITKESSNAGSQVIFAGDVYGNYTLTLAPDRSSDKFDGVVFTGNVDVKALNIAAGSEILFSGTVGRANKTNAQFTIAGGSVEFQNTSYIGSIITQGGANLTFSGENVVHTVLGDLETDGSSMGALTVNAGTTLNVNGSLSSTWGMSGGIVVDGTLYAGELSLASNSADNVSGSGVVDVDSFTAANGGRTYSISVDTFKVGKGGISLHPTWATTLDLSSAVTIVEGGISVKNGSSAGKSVLNFNNGSATVAGAVTNAGTINVNSGSVEMQKGLSGTGTLHLVGGRLTLNGERNSIGSFAYTGGEFNYTTLTAGSATINGESTLSNSGHLTVTGTLAGSIANTEAGKVTLAGGMSIAADTAVSITGAGITEFGGTLSNNGTLTLGGKISLSGDINQHYEVREDAGETSLYATDRFNTSVNNTDGNGFKLTSGGSYWLIQGGTTTLLEGITSLEGYTITQVTDANKTERDRVGDVYISSAYNAGREFYVSTGPVQVNADQQAATSYILQGGSMEITGGSVSASAITCDSTAYTEGNTTGIITVGAGASLLLDTMPGGVSLLNLLKGEGMVNAESAGRLVVTTAQDLGGAPETTYKGKLEIVGARLTIGSGQNDTNKLSSLSEIILNDGGNIFYNGKHDGDTSVMDFQKITVESGTGEFHLEDSGAVAGAADTIQFGEIAVAAGATMQLTSKWQDSAYCVDKLTGAGEFHAKSATDSGSNRKLTVNNLASFSGDLLFTNAGAGFAAVTVNTGNSEVNFRSLSVDNLNSLTLNVQADTTIGLLSAAISTVNVAANKTMTLGGGTAEAQKQHSIGTLSAASAGVTLGNYATLALGGGTHSIGTLSGSGVVSVNSGESAAATLSINKLAGYTGSLNAVGYGDNTGTITAHTGGEVRLTGITLDNATATITTNNNSYRTQYLGNVTLSNGATLGISDTNDLNDCQIINITKLDVHGSGNLKTTTAAKGWQAQFNISTLTGDTGVDGTLRFSTNSKTTNKTVFNLDGAGDVLFSGNISVGVDNNGNSRKAALNINNASVAQQAIITLESPINCNQPGSVMLGVGVDGATVRGIKDGENPSGGYSGGNRYIDSGQYTTDSENWINDEVNRTLVIATQNGDDFSSSATIGDYVSLQKDNNGSQTFNGNLSNFNGSIKVTGGTLALESSQAMNNAGNVTVTGGTLHVSNDISTTKLAVANEGIAKFDSTLTAKAAQLGEAATITGKQDGPATMSKVQMNSTGISGTAQDGSSRISNAEIEVLAQDATFTIEDMTLTNTSITAASVNIVDSKVSGNVVLNVMKPAEAITAPNVGQGGTGGAINFSYGLALENSSSSLTLNMEVPQAILPSESGLYTLTITLNGFAEDFDFINIANQVVFGADSWLGRALTGASTSVTVDGSAISAGDAAAQSSGTPSVSYNATSNVGKLVITINGLNVPEPTTSTLSLLALAALAARRRRK